ncbi:22923_t:CDS:10 [Entrophospora sp. SA101]|nr:22923_t:CDS:10 [Entrophospora sp. SA101]
MTDYYFSKAAAIAQNAAKLSKKVSEGLVENAREFGLEATSSNHYFETSEEKMRDIRRLLDSRHDREKMDGLKRLIAVRRDLSEFFPDVVKNVASQNLEIRKLVYIYLLRYAEQEPDLALLSINTFQKDLTDQNLLIRAMALRVMSGIRVPVINALVEIITTLLNDNSAFTLGSVIIAFDEVCPDRFDLIHPHFRKLCRMLIDADEWGQIAIMGLLLRYGRTQFLNPNPNGIKSSVKKKSKNFYSDEEDSENSEESFENTLILDPDHELILRSCLPLLQSRNSAVVMSVVKVLYHLAPIEEAYKIGKPLVRLLRSHREIQHVVLANIATMATQRPYLFEQHLQQFFVRSTDPSFIRNLKLEIMTLIATETNITLLLRELQEYVKSPNKDFATSAIQAIGRCAIGMPEMAESCLNGLMKLLWSKNDAVVAESVVVIKRLLQLRPQDNSDLIIQLAKALDQITVPMARASIFWLVGQYAENLKKIAPDVLRKAAKSFTNEADIAKLQIINLGAKLISLYPTNQHHQTLNLSSNNVSGAQQQQDDLQISSYEPNKSRILKDKLKTILLCEKEAPSEESASAGRDRFTIGSMALVLNRTIPGYEPIPDWPTEKPDGSLLIKGFGSDSFGGYAHYPPPSSSSFSAYDKKYTSKRKDVYDLERFYESDKETSEEKSGEEEEEGETSEEDVAVINEKSKRK